MISSFLASRFGPAILLILLVAGLLALTGLGAWKTVTSIQSIIQDRVTAAETARDAHWKSEIDTANAVAAQNIIAQMRAARAADLAAREEIQRLKGEVSQLEKKNEELPDTGGSGIGADRTRLLNSPYYGSEASRAH